MLFRNAILRPEGGPHRRPAVFDESSLLKATDEVVLLSICQYDLLKTLLIWRSEVKPIFSSLFCFGGDNFETFSVATQCLVLKAPTQSCQQLHPQRGRIGPSGHLRCFDWLGSRLAERLLCKVSFGFKGDFLPRGGYLKGYDPPCVPILFLCLATPVFPLLAGEADC